LVLWLNFLHESTMQMLENIRREIECRLELLRDTNGTHIEKYWIRWVILLSKANQFYASRIFCVLSILEIWWINCNHSAYLEILHVHFDLQFSLKCNNIVALLCNRRINNGITQSVSRQRIGKYIPVATNTGTTIESDWAQTRKWLRWRGPAAIVNDGHVLSSERAPPINKPATVRQ
jgi:hypothetical protein